MDKKIGNFPLDHSIRFCFRKNTQDARGSKYEHYKQCVHSVVSAIGVRVRRDYCVIALRVHPECFPVGKMYRRISAILLFFFIALSGAKPILNLRVSDINGKSTQEAVRGVPFLLEVIVEGDEQEIQSINVSGLNQFHAQNHGTMSSITQIHGTTTVKKTYRYKLRSNKIGSYTLGPAYATTQQGLIRSDSLLIKVVEEKKDDPNKSYIQLKLLTDKKCVVVGERIPIAIRLYVDPEYKLHGLYPSHSQLKSDMGTIVGPYAGSEKIDGITHSYREWYTEFIPQEQGTLIIPAFKIDYAQQKKQHGDPFDLLVNFGDLFGTRYEYQHVYSNPLIVTVDPLPAHQDSIKAIATFTNFTAHVDRENAREGDGIVYTLELQGDANWKDISYPSVVMPEALKYYESKCTKRDNKKGIPVAQKFEYIVQALKPGTWEIPSQRFTYFDTNERVYKTLSTNPICLTITPFSTKIEPTKVDDSADAVNKTDAIIPLVFEWPQPIGSLPWSWFLSICLVPLLYYITMILKSRWQRYKQINFDVLRRKYAQKRAAKKLAAASKKGDLKMVYDLFIDLFADRCGKDSSQLTFETMVHVLKDASVAPEIIDQWQLYFNQVAEIVFCNKVIDRHKKDGLFVGARQWLDKLGGVL